MQFITGDTGCLELIELLKRHGWGRMLINKSFKTYSGERWGFDNGQYSNFIKGLEFDPAKYLRRLKTAERMRARDDNELIMTVVPDIVQDRRSLEFSNGWIERPELDNGMPWHLAVQDGMLIREVEDAITRHNYTGIFLGGSNRFKLATAEAWADLAHGHGFLFHYGRCGTKKKIRHAKEIKADSADSNFPLFCYERYWQVQGYLEDGSQCSLRSMNY